MIDSVSIQSDGFWVKIVEMLQQNWALIEQTPEGGVRVYFMALLLNRMRHLVMAAARQARSLAPGARPTRWNQLR